MSLALQYLNFSTGPRGRRPRGRAPRRHGHVIRGARVFTDFVFGLKFGLPSLACSAVASVLTVYSKSVGIFFDFRIVQLTAPCNVRTILHEGYYIYE